jgi:hypothetical protein
VLFQLCCTVKVLLELELSVLTHACNPSYLGGGGRRIVSSRPAPAKLECDHVSKIKYKQKDWGHGTNGRALALRV